MSNNLPPLFIALLHHPVLNKHGEVVTTSVTNFDIHDLARTSRTYGVEKCFLVTPSSSQQEMIRYIKKYWDEGIGANFNPDRQEAFQTIELACDLDETCLTIQNQHGRPPLLVATTAKPSAEQVSVQALKERWVSLQKPLLLVFGTGWGLIPALFERMDAVLKPIEGRGDYNHLPVRAAVAIILDRLLA